MNINKKNPYMNEVEKFYDNFKAAKKDESGETISTSNAINGTVTELYNPSDEEKFNQAVDAYTEYLKMAGTPQPWMNQPKAVERTQQFVQKAFGDFYYGGAKILATIISKENMSKLSPENKLKLLSLLLEKIYANIDKKQALLETDYGHLKQVNSDVQKIVRSDKNLIDSLPTKTRIKLEKLQKEAKRAEKQLDLDEKL